MKALIIGSGNFSKNALKLTGREAYTICADGGYDHAKEHGIVPDILLGDLDSIKDKPEIKTIVFPAEKDETDSEIALKFAIDNGYSHIVMTGVTGTRLDHTLNNIFLLKTAKELGAKAVIADDNNEIYYVDGQIELFGAAGGFFSVIPISEEICVSIENAKYELFKTRISLGESRGISNEFLDGKCVITVESGAALVIKSED